MCIALDDVDRRSPPPSIEHFVLHGDIELTGNMLYCQFRGAISLLFGASEHSFGKPVVRCGVWQVACTNIQWELRDLKSSSKLLLFEALQLQLISLGNLNFSPSHRSTHFAWERVR